MDPTHESCIFMCTLIYKYSTWFKMEVISSSSSSDSEQEDSPDSPTVPLQSTKRETKTPKRNQDMVYSIEAANPSRKFFTLLVLPVNVLHFNHKPLAMISLPQDSSAVLLFACCRILCGPL